VTTSREKALQEVAEAVKVRDAAEEKVAKAVRRARTRKATWGEIGLVLGTTKQSAWERYGP
jgi:hypothetical protein